MALLRSILVHKPPEWDDSDYSNRRYVKITLNEHSQEYKQIISEFLQKFGSRKVLKIERVQHPFAFARFKIRKEQLTKTSRIYAEERKYLHVAGATHIENILEFNCDSRRGGVSYSSYSSLYSGNSGYVIVVKILGNMNERDTHRYPEYLIQYEIQSQQAGLSSGLDAHFSHLEL